MVGQADTLQQFGDALVDLPAGQFTGQGQRQRDVVGNGLGREQVEVLEDHPDLLAKAPQAIGVECGDFLTVDHDLAAGGFFQAVDQTQQGAFASAGMADQTEHLSGFDAQVGRMQGGNILTGNPVGFMDVMKLDHVANLVGRNGKGSAVSRARILACPYRCY